MKFIPIVLLLITPHLAYSSDMSRWLEKNPNSRAAICFDHANEVIRAKDCNGRLPCPWSPEYRGWITHCENLADIERTNLSCETDDECISLAIYQGDDPCKVYGGRSTKRALKLNCKD